MTFARCGFVIWPIENITLNEKKNQNADSGEAPQVKTATRLRDRPCLKGSSSKKINCEMSLFCKVRDPHVSTTNSPTQVHLFLWLKRTVSCSTIDDTGCSHCDHFKRRDFYNYWFYCGWFQFCNVETSELERILIVFRIFTELHSHLR